MKLLWLRKQNTRLKMVLACTVLLPFLIILSPILIAMAISYFLISLFDWAVNEVVDGNWRDHDDHNRA